MSKSIVAICLIALAALWLDSADARCHQNDRNCCRKRVEYGRCHNHVRRWGYNASCGQCVQFDYSGCGGDENNFELLEDCQSCCRGTPACPRYTLSRPSEGCEYRWDDAHDGCRRPRLECKCRESFCRHDSCRIGERCLAERHHRPCNRCPCQQYRCVTDPCYAVSRHLRPCEKCFSIPEPSCRHDHCPLIARRENHCAAEVLAIERRPFHHCPFRFDSCQHGDSCQHRRCHSQPRAKCIVDPCDCRKHWWSCDGRSYSDDECNRFEHGNRFEHHRESIFERR